MDVSLGKSVYVCGREIKKLPIGAYLRALTELTALPDMMFDKLLDGRTFSETVDDIANAGSTGIKELLAHVIETAPNITITFLSGLLNVPADELLNDERIGLDGLMEMVCVFAEVNGLKKCVNLWVRLKGLK